MSDRLSAHANNGNPLKSGNDLRGLTNSSHHYTADEEAFDRALEEIGQRIARGLPPNVERYSAELPQFVDRLRRATEGIEALMDVRSDPVHSPFRALTRGQLGDFSLIAEIGRGGMGTVFEAEQISLGRRVAVKVLSSVAMLDSPQVNRFRNEARAAATLDHPHIVPIYAVGQERGVHYYAMRIVDGPSLADVICHLRADRAVDSPALAAIAHPPPSSDPYAGTDNARYWSETRRVPQTTLAGQYCQSVQDYFRSIARIGSEAARALDHAHSQGIVHRDIKPANLLLDEQCHTFVTDFGLARVDNDVSLTATGDFVGTLRYVSPEQASLKRGVTDHRTDIYSLGVTLFELLCLRPALEGETRPELLRQLDFYQIPWLRKIDRRVPRDLERIVAKAIEHRAADRYATAGEMARDLERFLASEPVQARRASWLLSVHRWVQRYRLAASLAAVTIVLIGLLAVGGPLLAWRYNRLAAREAQIRDESDTIRERLQELLRDTVISSIEHLENTPDINDFHQNAIQNVLQQYENLLRLSPHDRSLVFDVGRAYARMGKVARLRFSRDEGLHYGRRGRELLESLKKDDPHNSRLLRELAEAQFWVGIEGSDGRALKSSIQSFTEVATLEPEDVSHATHLAVAREFYAEELRQLGELMSAEQAIETSLRSLREIRAREPNNLDAMGYESWVLSSSAELQRYLGRFDRAKQEILEALALGRLETSQRDGGTRGRIAEASALVTHARIAFDQRQYSVCQDVCSQTLKLLDAVLRGFPETSWGRSVHVEAQQLRADCRQEMGLLLPAELDYLAVLQQSKQHVDFLHRDWCEIHARIELGQLHWNSGQFAAAHSQFDKLVTLSIQTTESVSDLMIDYYLNCPDTVRRNPRRALDLAQLQVESQDGRTWWRLGICQLATDQHAAAVASFQNAILRAHSPDPAMYFGLATALAHTNQSSLAMYWFNLGMRHAADPSWASPKQIEQYRLQASKILSQNRILVENSTSNL